MEQSLSQLLQIVFAGITAGSIYALVAIGFNMVYNVTRIPNLAQGEFVMLGALSAVSFKTWVPMPVAFLGAVTTVALIGLAQERFLLRPARGASLPNLIILTLAASLFFEGAAFLVWGGDYKSLPPFSGNEPIRILGATLVPQTLWVVGTVLVVALALWLFFEKTILGKAMRGCAENPLAASLMGIEVKNMVRLSFAVSGGLGALAGIVVVPITFMEYDSGMLVGLKAFAVAILGGLGSNPGALLGGFTLGLLEALGAGYVSSEYKDAIAFVILLAVLFIRPSGIFGRSQ